MPCLHTPILLLALLLGFLGFRDGKRWAQALCFPLLTLTAHFHYIALGLLPLYAWLLWAGRKWIDWRAVGLSVVLAGALLAPFASSLPELFSGAADYLGGDSSGSFSLKLVGLAFLTEYATGSGLDVKMAEDGAAALRIATGWTPVWGIVLGGPKLAGIPLIFWRYRKIAVFVLLWAFLLTVILSPGWIEIFDHYLTLSLPALCILAGVAVEAVAALKFGAIPLGRWVALVGLAVVLLGQFGWWARLLDYLDHHTVSNFGTPLHAMDAACAQLA